MARKYNINEKKRNYQVMVTTYLKGKTKDAFMQDCIDREECEAKLAREIIQKHYAEKNNNNRSVY